MANIRLLKAEEIECRVGQKSKDGSKYSVLLYKTARCDMEILDEMFGQDNWQVEYAMIGSMLFCTVSIWSEARGCWVRKSSNGTESNIEAEKGQASDAFKRAGFMLGIGRELYSAPQIWLPSRVSPYSLAVSEIEYDKARRIKRLVITSDDKPCYVFPREQTEAGSETPRTTPDHETLEKISDIVEKLEFEGKKTDEILAYYHAKSIGEIPLALWEKMLAKVRGEA